MGQGNASYWEDRAERLLEAREALTAEQEQGLVDAFQAAQREIEAEIEKFCRRYAKNNKVTYAQAQKALSLKELARFRGNLPAFRKLAKAHIGEFRLEVDNLSAKAQVTRLQALKAEIDAALQRAYLQMEKGIEAGSLAVYDDQYHRSLFAMDRYAGFRHQYVGIDRDGIKAVTQYPFNGLDYSTRIWRQRDDLSYKLQSTLNTMLITGEPPDKYAAEFARIFKAKEQEAHRLLYTENAYVAEQAKLQAYRDTGVEEYEILATLDAKTSAICREQDGRQYPIGEEKPGINFPPFHPWCRTVTIPVVKGFSGEGMTRAARDPKTGKTIPVPASMTYGEWRTGAAMKTKSSGDQELGSKRGSTPIGKIDYQNRNAVVELLNTVEKQAVSLEYEVDFTVTTDGRIWYTKGESGAVSPVGILEQGQPLEGAYSYHNHPEALTYFSFSAEDVGFFFEYQQQYSAASDFRYQYWMERTADTVNLSYEEAIEAFEEIRDRRILQMALDGEIDMDLDGYHETMKFLSQKLCFRYERIEK